MHLLCTFNTINLIQRKNLSCLSSRPTDRELGVINSARPNSNNVSITDKTCSVNFKHGFTINPATDSNPTTTALGFESKYCSCWILHTILNSIDNGINVNISSIIVNIFHIYQLKKSN